MLKQNTANFQNFLPNKITSFSLGTLQKSAIKNGDKGEDRAWCVLSELRVTAGFTEVADSKHFLMEIRRLRLLSPVRAACL